MRVGLTADLQFDDQLSYSTRDGGVLSSRLMDTVKCFDWIVDECVDRGCEALYILGDVFDSRTSISISVLDAACRAVARASERLQVGILVGNHDSMLRTPTINSTQVFRGMAEVYETPMEVGDFAFLPWMEYDEDYKAAAENLAAGNAKYLCSHAMFEGAVPAAAGRSLDLINPDRWTRVLLGDVHEPVMLTPRIRYCGAPLQIHFGDAGGDRGFLVLDTEDDDLQFIQNTFSPRFVKAETKADLEGVRKEDFVRVLGTADENLTEQAREIAGWVASERVDLEDDGPRLSLSATDDHAEVVQQWLDYRGIEDEELRDLAVSILQQSAS